MGEQGSTAELAKLLEASVVLVMDAQGMGRSAAALLQGFQRFDPAVNFLGAILNRVGSDRHRAWIRRACEAENLRQAQHTEQHLENGTMAILGGLPREDALHIPRRHLGLVLGGEDEADPEDGDRLDRLGQWVEHYLDLDQLYHSAKTYPSKTPFKGPAAGNSRFKSCPRGSTVRIGVARDRAFCFHYEYNLALLKHLGAELVEFSPLTASRLPANLCGLYFAGGYPELHAEMLSDNFPLRQQISGLSRAGLPIYGECGGLMYLSQGVTDAAGNRYPMVGALPFEIVMSDRPTLGYKEVQWTGPDGWFPTDVTARGHCFHYSKLSMASPTPSISYGYRLKTSQGKVQQEGYLHQNTLASYVHLHWGSCPDWARSWLALCRRSSVVS
ncbi:MAG: cobyrinate a,c-diamide synthase, partial [Cyanobacteria bacterium P01_H01_bin.130]